jgi:hypothetical protein
VPFVPLFGVVAETRMEQRQFRSETRVSSKQWNKGARPS